MATYLPNITDVFPEPSLFTPDFSFMDKMLQRREQLYQQGFAQVNSKFNWINRETTNAANTALKEDFIRQARENLKNLSAMDLSQPQNVDAAAGVFEPFVKNTNVLGDQAVTEHWIQQENIGNGFRLKDGGKEFSEDNVNYIRQQRAAYAQDDPNSWNQYYANKRFYSPYYDYSKEVADAMKEFKPDNSSITSMKGMYFIKEKDASVRPAAVKRYLDAVLSDKAKQQMKIEAVVRLGSDKNALVGKYQSAANSQIKVLDKEIDLVSVRMKVEKDPAKLEQMREYRSSLENSKEGYKTDLENIRMGKVAPVLSKAENIAFDIYYNDKVNKWSNGYARVDYEKDITANTVAFGIWKDGQEWARQKDSQKHAKEMKLLELGIANTPSGFNMVITGEDDVSVVKGFQDVTNSYIDNNKKMRAATNDFTDAILKYYATDGVTTKEDKLTKADLLKDPSLVENFMKQNQGLKFVGDYQNNVFNLKRDNDRLQNIMNSARETAANKLTPEEKQKIKNFESKVDVVGGVSFYEKGKLKNYSARDIYRGLLNGTVTFKQQGNIGYLNVDGKEYLVGQGQKDAFVNNAFNKITAIKNMIDNDKELTGTIKKLNKEVHNQIQSSENINATAQILDPESKAVKSLKSKLKGYFPTIAGNVDIEGISQSYEKNRTYFTISAASDKAKLQGGANEALDVTMDNAYKVLQSKTAAMPGVKIGKWSGGLYIEDPNMMFNSMGSNLTPAEKSMLDWDRTTKNFESLPWYPLGAATDSKGNVYPAFRYEKTVNESGDSKYYLFDATNGGGMLGGKVYDNLRDLMMDAKAYSIDPISLQLAKP